MGKLNERVVLITGASSGIGAGLAREAARQGAKLVLIARRAEKLEALAAQIDPSGQKVLAIPADVSQDGELEKVATLARTKFGQIDIAIANAGSGMTGNLEDLSMDDYRRQWETNVFGVLRTIYATLNDLKQNRGQLVIIGSVNGYVTFPGISSYAMSKFALRALCESLSQELAPYGVSASHICPGFVATESRLAKRQGTEQSHNHESIPDWMLMSTDETARQIWLAVERRKQEAILTSYGQLAVWLKRHLPGLLAWLFSILKINERANPRTAPPKSPTS